MFRLTVVHSDGQEAATAVISGEAVFVHAQEMQSALGDALASCQHLTIELGKVAGFDATFRALVCSLHRQSELVHKKITLQGHLAWREDPLGSAGIKGCLLEQRYECCRLWETILTGAESAAGPPSR